MEPLSQLLESGGIALDVPVENFDACLDELSLRLTVTANLDSGLQSRLIKALREREGLGGTCLGQGVAIPHAYIEGLPQVTILFARLAQPVDHDAPDGAPVDLVLLLAGPRSAQSGHLPLLARIARLLHDQRLLEELRAGQSTEDVLRAIRAVEQRHA